VRIDTEHPEVHDMSYKREKNRLQRLEELDRRLLKRDLPRKGRAQNRSTPSTSASLPLLAKDMRGCI
jgi:hypothetical protein